MKTSKVLFFFLLVTAFSIQVSAQDDPEPKKYHHVLLLQWADSIDMNVKTEVLNLFKGLPSKIEGFEKVDIVELTKSSDNFDTAIIQVYSSEEAHKKYEEHPDHQRISEIGPPLLSGFGEFDYWK